MSIQYVIARPCKECMEKEEEEHGLSYLMEEDNHQEGKGITKVFNSQKEAKRWLRDNIHPEDQKDMMIIPLNEVPEWDGKQL